MALELAHVGFGNYLAMDPVVAVATPASAPTKRLIQEAKVGGHAIDMTNGRRTKAVLMMDSGHVVLIAVPPETVSARVRSAGSGMPA